MPLDWKQRLTSTALNLMQDPRVAKLLQDPRVMSGLMGAMRLQSDLKRNLDASVRRLAKSFNLATESEVVELKRAISRLEREVERARASRHEAAGDRSSS
jgi:hypothetical protein